MMSNTRRITVSVVMDAAPGPAARHGLRKLRQALQRTGAAFEEASSTDAVRGDTLVVAGAAGSQAVKALLDAAGSGVPEGPESLVIRCMTWQGKPAVLAAGGDDRGLMYALLEIADRIGWSDNPAQPLREVKDAVEQPAVRERSVSVYTMHRLHFEQRFHNPAYWSRYLDMLAETRFNTFALLFAYESAGYLAPPYPYFFHVEAFPGVRVTGLTEEHQRRNLTSLNRLIEMTHERGLDFTLGIWDHIYRGGVQQGPGQDPDNPLPWRVVGVTAQNLMAYSVAALTRLVTLVPNLDAIQFRMHGESGLTEEEMNTFWADIYRVMKDYGQGIRFDARAKGFPDHLIDLALVQGVDIRICTKYWMEQMGLPFHPTHVHPRNQKDRRHSYADLLRYPKRYPIFWRLWNGGTSRILLWGDPEYVRRFVDSTRLYDGDGFDVNEPLATKMASHDHDAAPFDLLNPAYRYYDWEFERYWHFFQVFGRVGYNPETSSDIWEQAFERRFGKAAPHVARGLHLASRILPRIVAYTYPYNLFPTTRGWIEKQRMEDLPAYAEALPSDTEQFLSIDRAARNLIDGRDSAKIHPQTTGAWFARIASDVLDAVDKAERRIGDRRHNEFVSTMTDLRILACLALYHARRIHAGLNWSLFRHTRDLHAFDDAIHHEGQAVEAWERLVEAAGDVYHHDLMMGRPQAGLAGHWKDELAALRHGLEQLQEERARFQPEHPDEKPLIAHVPVRRVAPGQDLIIRATVSGRSTIASVRIGYGTGADAYTYRAMDQTDGILYRTVIPGSEVTGDLFYFIEAVDAHGRTILYPSEGSPFAVAVTDDNEPPVVTHTPVRRAPATQPLTITAQVSDPSGVRWIHVRYRSVTQVRDFQTMAMHPTGQADVYQAVIPGECVDPRWDFMYLIEAMDLRGNGKIYPDLEHETPYVVVRLERKG